MNFRLALFVLACVGLLAVAGVVAAAQWSPSAKASAQIALEQSRRQAQRDAVIFAGTKDDAIKALRVVIWSGALTTVAVCLAVGVIALSIAARHVRATVELSPWQVLPQRAILMPRLAYDPRHGGADDLTAPHEADLERMELFLHGQGEARRAILEPLIRVSGDRL